jgi:hypothetical protein
MRNYWFLKQAVHIEITALQRVKGNWDLRIGRNHVFMLVRRPDDAVSVG